MKKSVNKKGLDSIACYSVGLKCIVMGLHWSFERLIVYIMYLVPPLCLCVRVLHTSVGGVCCGYIYQRWVKKRVYLFVDLVKVLMIQRNEAK